MKPVICIEPLYPDRSPTEKIATIASFGFHDIEFWNWRDKDIPSLLNACSKHQVRVVNFSGHRVGSPAAKETHHVFLQDLADAVATARQLDCHRLMLLTNALNPDGSVTDAFEHIPDEEKCTNTILGLKKALEVVPQDIQLVLEPLNILVDHPGYFLNDMETAAALIRDVNTPRLKILCDLYHLGVMGSDLKHLISNFIQDIGYFHVADFPGRHEPGTGSADWPDLLRLIKKTGYTGYVGFEYFPQYDSDASLTAIKQLWDAL